MSDIELNEGDRVTFTPAGGGEFPTGEKTRTGWVDTIQENTIYVEQRDEFIVEITEDQIIR